LAEEALSKVDTHDLKLISTSQSNMLMKLSFCPQKILLIRPLAKSFPVMGVWCRCTLHDGGGEYGGGAKVKKSTWNIYAGVSKSSKNGVFFIKAHI